MSKTDTIKYMPPVMERPQWLGYVKLVYPGVIYSKKNSKRIVTNRRTGRPVIVSNRNAKEQEIEMMWLFEDQAMQQGWNPKLGESYKIDIKIWQKDNHRRDLDNQATAILDGLVKSNVIPDDNCFVLSSLSIRNCGIDKENPRAEIYVEAFEND